MVVRGNWALGIRFSCGGKGFLLAFIAHTSSLFQIEFLPNTKIKTQDKTKPNKTEQKFVFVSIDWVVVLCPSHIDSIRFLFFVPFSFFLFFYHSLAYRLLRNISIVQRLEQIETSEMFAQNAIQNVCHNEELLLHQARRDLSQTECTSERTNERTKRTENNNNVENVNLRTTSRFIAD